MTAGCSWESIVLAECLGQPPIIKIRNAHPWDKAKEGEVTFRIVLPDGNGYNAIAAKLPWPGCRFSEGTAGYKVYRVDETATPYPCVLVS